MEKELENIKFKYPFRDYQQETLTMLKKYIHDRKLHIVAAPERENNISTRTIIKNRK